MILKNLVGGALMSPFEITTRIKSMYAGQPIEKELLDALQSGFNSYLYEGNSLDDAFGFTQTRIRDSYTKEWRNRYLRMAAKTINAEGASKKAKVLETEINRFEQCVWPMWCDLDMPPIKSSLLRKYLFYAKKSSDKLPSYRQLIRIIE